jgi:GntR family transcriptional regulator / MocR family aminotransferase
MAAYDLAIRIEGQTGLAAQLYRELRRAILEGRLRSGERLPSSRNLALISAFPATRSSRLKDG